MVQAALRGGSSDVRKLVDYLAPRIRAAVRGRLRSWYGCMDGHGVEDLVQIVLLSVFEPSGGVLSKWDPSRGGLGTFVGRVAVSRLLEIERRALRRRALLSRQMQEAPTSFDPVERFERVDLLRRTYRRLAADCGSCAEQQVLARLFEVPGAPEPSSPRGRQSEARVRHRLRTSARRTFGLERASG